MPATPTLLEDLTATVTQDAAFSNAEVWMSTHSANPGSDGANELTSGSGAAGRQQVTFSEGDSGTDTSNALVSVAVPDAQTIPWIGLWTAQTDGTFLGGYPLVSTQMVATGLEDSTFVTCPANDLSVNDQVRLFTTPNAQSSIPSGFSGDPSIFYVVATPDVDTLELSSTLGGDAIEMSSSGGFLVAQDETQVFGSDGGLLNVSVGNFVYSTVS